MPYTSYSKLLNDKVQFIVPGKREFVTNLAQKIDEMLLIFLVFYFFGFANLFSQHLGYFLI